MMRRTGFAKPQLERRPPPPAMPLQRPVVIARISTQPQAIPKEVKARKGKRAPTVAERAWMDAIVAHGCVACRMDGHGYVPACVHHILRGGHRIGHLFSLPLCPGHHQAGTGAPGLIARHPNKSQFEQKYGSEDHLLRGLQLLLGFKTP